MLLILSHLRKEGLQNRVHLSCQAIDRVLVRIDRDTKHRVHETISIHKDAKARGPTELLHNLPVARDHRDVVDLNAFAVARLVVADEESDVLWVDLVCYSEV
jgi:hypothetical protein